MPNARVVARVALAGMAQNVLVPLASAMQLAVFGWRASSEAQASFGLVVGFSNFGASALNFLADGVAAKVGTHLGAKDASRAAACARAALVCALACGVFAAGALFAARDAAFRALSLDARVDAISRDYFAYRVAGVPFACVFACGVGLMQGYGRVRRATTMTFAARFVGETSATALAVGIAARDDRRMMRVAGIAYACVVTASAAWATREVTTTTPRGRRRPLPVWSAPRLNAAETFDFARDAASMVCRSLLLQSSFVLAMVIAAKNFTPSGLAAHHIVASLWMLCAYACDGYATAAVVLGSRLRGRGKITALVRLSRALATCGALTGLAFSIILVVCRDVAPNVFTRDEATKTALRASGVWDVLVLAQPVNAACFVYDGFIYATHSFSYAREVMSTGVGLVFLPTLFLANRPRVSLRGVWTAKAALNAWRAVWLAGRVHAWLPRQRAREGEEESEEESDDDDDSYGDDATTSEEESEEESFSFERARGGGDDSYAEPLLPGTTRDGEEEEEEEEDVEHGGTNVQYESALKPSKIKSRNLSPIRTPELAMARASNLRASAGAFTPRPP